MSTAPRAPRETLVGTTIYSQAGAPVIAVQDGEIVQIGDSPSLGHFVSLRDAYGNTYVYAQLGEVASVYPVLEPHVHSAPSARGSQPSAAARTGAERTRDGRRAAALAAVGGRRPSRGWRWARRPAWKRAPSASRRRRAGAARDARAARRAARTCAVFSEGSNEVYLHPLRPGVQVIAGTVLGHVGADASTPARRERRRAAHLLPDPPGRRWARR